MSDKARVKVKAPSGPLPAARTAHTDLVGNRRPLAELTGLRQTLASPPLRQAEHLTPCPVFPRACPFGGVCHTCPARVQAKLVVGQPDDQYEREADRVADQVMRMPEPHMQRQAEPKEAEEEETLQAKPLASLITPLIQRQAEPEEGEEEEEPTQAQAASGRTPALAPTLQVQLDALAGGGQPLPASVRAFFEPRFGYDFSQVRIHSDAWAVETARGLNARAFAHREGIWLGKSESSANRPLLAHELAHTIQQGAVPCLKGPSREGTPSVSVKVMAPDTGVTRIQTSVQETGVRSPGTVLTRIRSSLNRSAIKNALCPIPWQLRDLGYEFHPGKGVDDPRNAFVYTCKGGWIDMGHFFFTAMFAALALFVPNKDVKQLPLGGAHLVEAGQQRERLKYEQMPVPEREKHFGRSWKEATPEQLARRGNAWSAYTIEDLPSDKFGFDFGKNLRPVDDIYERIVGFFNQKGAVDASNNKDRLRKMMVETLGSEDPEKLPRQHLSEKPVLLESARSLCGSQ